MTTDTVTTPKMTAEEFFEWVARPENEGRRFELENGEVVEMSSPGELHGFYCWLVIKLLTEFAARRGSGYLLTNDTGLVVRRGPDTVRGPDAMFFLEQPDPARMSRKHCERVPTLAVEVVSPTDSMRKTMTRVEQYLRRGVQLVWVIDPDERIVYVHKPNEFHKILDETEELTGNGVLPDFSCRVAELFALPGQPQPPTT
jgi:Uma2 family endonuclease